MALSFIPYSHADVKYLDRLHKHVSLLQREGSIETWSDHQIVPGAKLDKAMMNALRSSENAARSPAGRNTSTGMPGCAVRSLAG
ncbi:toll/interleukin-1 receptor domain-containing protein [Ensifer sp. ENS07]|nr:toll/interleukin-1 receptor domain-containing protein [Ensifer sp. ENS07]